MPPAKGFGKPKNTKKTIGRLIQLMKKYSGLWIIVFICVLLSSGAGVAGGYMINPAINNYIMPLIGQENPDLSGFLSFLVLVMVIYSVGAFAQWLNSRLIMKISTGVNL